MSKQNVEIVLDYPVQLADSLLDKVIMRRPTVEDAIKYPVTTNHDLENEATLLSSLCGIHLEDIKKFDLYDYEKVQKQVNLFRNNKT